MTLDLWTNHYTHVSFLAITCHFINENEQENKLQLNNYVLKNAEINEKTGDKIRGVLIEVLHEMKCYRIDNVYVTDNGKNVQRAVDIFNHISCAGHNLNLVLKCLKSLILGNLLIDLWTKSLALGGWQTSELTVQLFAFQ